MGIVNEKVEHFRQGKGFVAALDQSGGSTPKTLEQYGVAESDYNGDGEMFDMVHRMRERIFSDPAFTEDRIIGTILFEDTLNRMVDGIPTASYLWNEKQIPAFVKIDKGLEEPDRGVRLMKQITDLDMILTRSLAAGAFGTKMRSVIDEADRQGIEAVVEQQFDLAVKVDRAGLLPIIEPEVSIGSESKMEAEKLLMDALLRHLGKLDNETRVVLKLTLPEEPGFHRPLMENGRVVRVMALSGGYSRDEATSRLAQNNGVIASFSRALLEDLRVTDTDGEFSRKLGKSIESIYQASVS